MVKPRGLERLRKAQGLDLSNILDGIKPRTKLEDHPEVLAEILKAEFDLRYAATAKEAGKAAARVFKALAKAGLSTYGVG